MKRKYTQPPSDLGTIQIWWFTARGSTELKYARMYKNEQKYSSIKRHFTKKTSQLQQNLSLNLKKSKRSERSSLLSLRGARRRREEVRWSELFRRGGWPEGRRVGIFFPFFCKIFHWFRLLFFSTRISTHKSQKTNTTI